MAVIASFRDCYYRTPVSRAGEGVLPFLTHVLTRICEQQARTALSGQWPAGFLVFSLTATLACAQPPITTSAPASQPADAWRANDPFVQAVNRGVALMERYEYSAAVEAFARAVELKPPSIATRVNLAIATYNRAAKGDLERSEALLDDVLRDEPDNLRALYFRGIIHQYSGRDEPAVACFERVLKLAPHDACTWYLLARSKSHLGQSGRAELERAIKENPALASAYYDLMRLAAQEGKQEEAQTLQEKFTKLRQSPLCEMVTMPHYRQMGPLGVVRPEATRQAASPAGGDLVAAPARTLFEAKAEDRSIGPLPGHSAKFAFADVNGDGRLDVAMTALDRRKGGSLSFFLGRADGTLADASTASGLAAVKLPEACSFGDYDNDCRADLFVACAGPNYLFRGRGDGTFENVTSSTNTAGPDFLSASGIFLDADHDGDLDIYVCNFVAMAESLCEWNQLLNNNSDGTFTDIAHSAGVARGPGSSHAVVPVDLDGDRDADLIVFNANRYSSVFINDRLGKYHEEHFTGHSIEGPWGGVAQDFDGDGLVDLLVLPGLGGNGRLFLTRVAGEDPGKPATSRPDDAGEMLSIAAFKDGQGPRPQTPLQPERPRWTPSPQFEECVKAARTWGDIRATRVGDVDLDGDLDVVLFGSAGHALLNDGTGRFILRPNVWPAPVEGLEVVAGEDLFELTGDGIPDVLWFLVDADETPTSKPTSAPGSTSRPDRDESRRGSRLVLVPTRLTPPANWLAVTPTGDRGEDQRTRSPAIAFGTRLELRCGLHSQVQIYTGLNGGACQSVLPVIFGLNGAARPDYLAITWPDGVTQCENDLAANKHHRVSEMERRVSSCPVLFAWNGERFGFVGDFAGVGGLGYYVAPGQYASPQALEHVKIEPSQLAPRDGRYELRICEPMEEVAYIDRLELLAVDHPRDAAVYPDEHLTVTGPPPTHRLLCVGQRVYPEKAVAPDGTDCTQSLTEADREYACQPPLDRRFVGFCRPHTLVLDFGDRLADLPPDRDAYLFLNGWIEYPYSQTTFAAAQAGVAWSPLKVERRRPNGEWETIIPDAGAPGGMARTIAIRLPHYSEDRRLAREGEAPSEPRVRRSTPLSHPSSSDMASAALLGYLPDSNVKLRLSTNLEIYVDQAFIAVDQGSETVTVRSVPLAGANLRRLGFPAEYSPDGRHPTIYDYDRIEPTSSFKIPRGLYTRYGPVEELLREFDDRYVILGTGDEIAVDFDARPLPPILQGCARSFILVSHAYCKDMDLYTAVPDTVEPLPFRGMSAYPPPAGEAYPDTKENRSSRERFETREEGE